MLDGLNRKLATNAAALLPAGFTRVRTHTVTAERDEACAADVALEQLLDETCAEAEGGGK